MYHTTHTLTHQHTTHTQVKIAKVLASYYFTALTQFEKYCSHTCHHVSRYTLDYQNITQVKIAKVLAAREQAQRKRNLTKYIPNAAAAIFTVLEKMAGSDARGPKRRRLQEEQQQQTGQEVLALVENKEVGRGAGREGGCVSKVTCSPLKRGRGRARI